jgi:hypothetical protein
MPPSRDNLAPMAPKDPACAEAPQTGTPSPGERAHVSAVFVLSLAELLRGGARTPRALTAMAARHRQQGDVYAPVFERIAIAVREEGNTLADALHTERRFFTPRFLAAMTLANLGGELFRVFVQRLRGYVPAFQAAPPTPAPDFPVMQNETSELCFLFGHLILERASQPEIQQWLPRVFSPAMRLPVTHLLGRFFDQGLPLSQSCLKTPPFNDPEVVLAVRVGEERNQVGRELLSLAQWLIERDRLEERLRMLDWILPGAPPPPTG